MVAGTVHHLVFLPLVMGLMCQVLTSSTLKKHTILFKRNMVYLHTTDQF